MLLSYLIVGSLIFFGVGIFVWFVWNFERDSKKFYKDYLNPKDR